MPGAFGLSRERSGEREELETGGRACLRGGRKASAAVSALGGGATRGVVKAAVVFREKNAWWAPLVRRLASPLAFYFASESAFLLDEAGGCFSRSIFYYYCFGKEKIQSCSILRAL